MNNENASCVQKNSNDKKKLQLSLPDLPREIIEHICSFLDASTIVDLSLVSINLNFVINNDFMWKERMKHMWPNAKYPIFAPAKTDNKFWQNSCVASEKETFVWKQQSSMKKLSLRLDRNTLALSLLIHNDGLIGIECFEDESSPQSRYNKLVHYKFDENSLYSTVYVPSAGKEDDYFRDLAIIDNTIYSCHNHNIITSWILANTGFIQQTIYNISCEDELVCLSSCPEGATFAAGSSKGNIFVFDPRSGCKPINQYTPDKSWVKNLTMNTEYILSASYDASSYISTVSVYDKKASQIMKSFKVCHTICLTSKKGTRLRYCKYTFKISDNAPHPILTMNMQRNWVGVASGTKLFFLNLKNDFEVKSYFTEHTSSITGLHLTHGSIITSSMDGTVRISSLTDPPKPIATLYSGSRTAVNWMDYRDGILATVEYNRRSWNITASKNAMN